MVEAPTDHAECKGFLRDRAKGLGVEVTVSDLPPAVRGPYTTDPFVCPHGTAFWIEPTGEQIAEWAKNRVE